MRVVAGRFRGRRLSGPEGEGTRPTADRVKEALFSILGEVRDDVVLDLYAGTGALGIEALSRGASRAVFVEALRPASRVVAKNLAALGLGRSDFELVEARAERSVRRLKELGPFTLVLCDPPYAELAAALSTLAELAEAQAFTASVRIVVEHATRDEVTLAGFEVATTRAYGDTSITILESSTANLDEATSTRGGVSTVDD